MLFNLDNKEKQMTNYLFLQIFITNHSEINRCELHNFFLELYNHIESESFDFYINYF